MEGGYMEKAEAYKIVMSIKDSLAKDPGQFNISINLTGQHVVSHGGTGISVSVTGGGPGSTTIGQRVSVDGAQFEIATATPSAAMDQQIKALVDTLQKIADQLAGDNPDSGVISRLYNSMKGTWVPGVITSVLGTVLSKWLGL
jgi:hypothetical protein